MSTKEPLQQHCRAAFFGPAWHGPSLRAALAGVTPEQALARPLPGGHSIAELVGHIIFWQDVACRRLQGLPASVTPRRNFPGPVTSAAHWWLRLRQALRSSHQQVLDALNNLPEKDLTRLVPRQRYTTGFMLAGVADHALYHAGQIAQLKKSFLRQQVSSGRKSRE